MPPIILTREIAQAVGMDAGNASMRKAGRKVWNEDDYNVAARTTNELLDIIDGPEIAAAYKEGEPSD